MPRQESTSLRSSGFLEQLRQHRLMAILRLRDGQHPLELAVRLLDAGLQILEITVDSPSCFEAVKALRRSHPQAWIGVGTVLEVTAVEPAASAGAQFLVSPGLRPRVAAACLRHGLGYLPGAFTPSEVLNAWDDGCSAVKLFPASLGGAPYLRELRAPLPHIPLVAVGGVKLENAGAFLGAGAVAVGVGSAFTQVAPEEIPGAVRHWLQELA